MLKGDKDACPLGSMVLIHQVKDGDTMSPTDPQIHSAPGNTHFFIMIACLGKEWFLMTVNIF